MLAATSRDKCPRFCGKMPDVRSLDELAVAAREGNPFALDRFTSETLPLVRALCWHLGDPDNAEDLVQETYERMMKALPQYRGDGSSKGWLSRIARNTCADAARRRSRRRMHFSSAELPDSEAPPPPGWLEVQSILEPLDEDRRTAFVLTQVLCMSYSEAAEVLSCPTGTIRSRVARARSELLTLVAEVPLPKLSAPSSLSSPLSSEEPHSQLGELAG